MNKNKGFIGIGLIVAIVLGIVIVGGGAYYLGAKKNIKIVENNSYEVPAGPYGTEADYVAPTPIIDNKKVDTINSAPTKIISTTLPAKYLDSQNWPPVVKTSGFAYSCKVSSGSGDVPTVVEEKIINGKKYCITSLIDAGAGSRFGEYTYMTLSTSGSGTKTTSFNLRWSSCGAYDKPEADQCQTTVSTFLNNLDAMVDSLMQS